MATGENMQFPIPNSVLEPYIRDAVSAAIVASLGDGTQLIAKAVHAAMGTKVNSKGFVSTSSYENSYNLVEVVAANRIREIAVETVNQMAEGMRPGIKAEVEKHIKKNHGKLAEAMVNGLMVGLTSNWSVSIKFAEDR